MAAADALYFIVSPDPSAPGSRHYNDTTGPYYYIKFGDGGSNHDAYRRANPDFRMQVNAGVDPRSIIEFIDPRSGKKVTQRFAKFLEKGLLVKFDQAHGGGSEWYIVRPTAGLTYQQLGANLTTLLASFSTINLEKHYDTFIQLFERLMQQTT